MARISEFGRKWNVKVPRYAVGRWIAGFHVSATQEEIFASLEPLMSDKLGYTDGIRKQTREYAMECHRRNQALYNRVMKR